MNDTFRHRGVLVGEHVRVAAVGTETALGPVVDADAAPLQTAGGPELLAREQYGGPESGFDTRMYLDAAQLERTRERLKSLFPCGTGFQPVAHSSGQARPRRRHRPALPGPGRACLLGLVDRPPPPAGRAGAAPVRAAVTRGASRASDVAGPRRGTRTTG